MIRYWYVPVTLLALLLWVHEHDKAVRALVEVKSVTDSIKYETRITDSIVAVSHRKDVENTLLQMKYDSVIRQSASAERNHAKNTQAIIDSINTHSDSTTKAAVAQVSAAFQRERVDFQGQIQALTSANLALNQQLTDKQHSIDDLNMRIAQITSQSRTLAKAASPGVIQKLGQALPYLAGGYLLGRVL